LARLGAEVDELAPDLVVAACFRRSWLDTVIAASAPGARRVAFGTNAEDPFFAVQLRQISGGKPGTGYDEVAPAASGDQDWRRNFGLVDYLIGKRSKPTVPSMAVGPDLLARADEILRGLGLEPGSFVACAAAGFANVSIKTWPSERFASTLSWLRADRGVRTLLVGQANERGYLEALAAKAGSAQAMIWTGGEEDLPLLAAILRRSSLFFGNDTGALHLAAALSRSVVGIFGGGTWPRFLPAAQRSIALVHPLPCFGCGWDCAFGDAPCVSAVGEDDVRRALSDVLRELPIVAAGAAAAPQRSAEDGCEVRELRSLPETVIAFMGKAAAFARERTAAHQARELKLEEMGFLAGAKEDENQALKRVLDEREAELSAKESEIDEKDEENRALKKVLDEREKDLSTKESEIAAKDEEIRSLKKVLDRRETDLSTKDEENHALKKVLDDREGELSAKESEIAAKDGEIQALKKVLDEREADLSAKEEENHALKKVLDDREGELSTKESEIGTKDGEIRALKNVLDDRESDLSAKESEIAAKDEEIRALKKVLNAREAELSMKESAIHAKQAEIDSLARACEERLKVIGRLDADLKGRVAEIERLRAEIAAGKHS
jgi:septal ring factor EnvC (AmiA/AmiB activator)